MPVLNHHFKSNETFTREEQPLHFFFHAGHKAYPDRIPVNRGTNPIFDSNGVIVAARSYDFNNQRFEINDLTLLRVEEDKLWAEYLIENHTRIQQREFKHHEFFIYHKVIEAIKGIEEALHIAPSYLTLHAQEIFEYYPEQKYTVNITSPHEGGFIIRDTSNLVHATLGSADQSIMIDKPFYIHLGTEFIMPSAGPMVVGTLNNSTPFTVSIKIDGVPEADSNPIEVLKWESHEIVYTEPFQILRVERLPYIAEEPLL